MKKTINTAIIGFGVGGNTFHAPVIATTEGFKINRIRARKDTEVNLARERYPGVVVTDNADDIMNDPDIELVVITTPNAYHHPLAKQALLAGKHVVVDKPITITSADADDLIKTAKAQNRILSVYHNRRFDSDFAKTMSAIFSSLLEYKLVSTLQLNV